MEEAGAHPLNLLSKSHSHRSHRGGPPPTSELSVGMMFGPCLVMGPLGPVRKASWSCCSAGHRGQGQPGAQKTPRLLDQ